jgi:hypothetical protein
MNFQSKINENDFNSSSSNRKIKSINYSDSVNMIEKNKNNVCVHFVDSIGGKWPTPQVFFFFLCFFFRSLL